MVARSKTFSDFMDVGARTTFDKKFWNTFAKLLDIRFDVLEVVKIDWEEAVDQLNTTGLERINEVLAPAYAEIEALAHLGTLLSTTSETTNIIQTGQAAFSITEEERDRFAPSGYMRAVPVGETGISMAGELNSYDRDTGVLIVDIVETIGSGTFSDWSIAIGVPTDLNHATRTDNPHSTTIDQALEAGSDQVTRPFEIVDAEELFRNSDDTVAEKTHASFARGDGTGDRWDVRTKGDSAKGAKSVSLVHTDGGRFDFDALTGLNVVRPEDDATWQSVLRLLRGEGSQGISLQSLGDGAGGVDGCRLYEDASGETLMELGTDGAVDFKGQLKKGGTPLVPLLQSSYFSLGTDYARSSTTYGNVSDALTITPTFGFDQSRISRLFVTSMAYCRIGNTGTTNDDFLSSIYLGYYRDSESSYFASPGGGTIAFGQTNIGEPVVGSVYSGQPFTALLSSVAYYQYLTNWHMRLQGKVSYVGDELSMYIWGGWYIETEQ